MDLHGRLLWQLTAKETSDRRIDGEAAGGPWTAHPSGAVPRGFDPCRRESTTTRAVRRNPLDSFPSPVLCLPCRCRYALPAVLIAVGTFAAWTWDAAKTARRRTSSPPARRRTGQTGGRSEGAVAGKITGMTNCRWGDLNRTATAVGTDVALGQMLSLESAKARITYTSGEKLTLHAAAAVLRRLARRPVAVGQGGRPDAACGQSAAVDHHWQSGNRDRERRLRVWSEHQQGGQHGNLRAAGPGRRVTGVGTNVRWSWKRKTGRWWRLDKGHIFHN